MTTKVGPNRDNIKLVDKARALRMLRSSFRAIDAAFDREKGDCDCGQIFITVSFRVVDAKGKPGAIPPEIREAWRLNQSKRAREKFEQNTISQIVDLVLAILGQSSGYFRGGSTMIVKNTCPSRKKEPCGETVGRTLFSYATVDVTIPNPSGSGAIKVRVRIRIAYEVVINFYNMVAAKNAAADGGPAYFDAGESGSMDRLAWDATLELAHPRNESVAAASGAEEMARRDLAEGWSGGREHIRSHD